MISVSFFGNIDDSLITGSAAFARIILAVVSAAIFGHLRCGNCADLRVEIDTAGICMIYGTVTGHIYTPAVSAIITISIFPAASGPSHPGMPAIARLHSKIRKCYDPDKGSYAAVYDDIDMTSVRHDPGFCK